jgi:hypothetical protein
MKSVNSLSFGVLKDALLAGGILADLYAVEHPQHCVPAFVAADVMQAGLGACQATSMAQHTMDSLIGKEGVLVAIGQLCFMSTSCHAVGEQVNYGLDALRNLSYMATIASRQR